MYSTFLICEKHCIPVCHSYRLISNSLVLPRITQRGITMMLNSNAQALQLLTFHGCVTVDLQLMLLIT